MIDKDDILSSFEKSTENDNIPKKLTILPLRDILIFPYMIFPVLIGRNSSLKAVAEAMEREKYIFVTAQKNASIDEPGFDDIYQYGTIAKIIQVLRLPNNLLKVLVEGLFQGKIEKKEANDDYLEARVKQIEVKYNEKDKELTALLRHTSELFEEYVRANNKMPPDLISAYDNINDPLRKMFYAAANIQSNIEDRQELLEKRFLKQQYYILSSLLGQELEMLHLESEIDTKIHESIHKTQKKFYIQEQIRALQKELGEEDDGSPEIVQLRKAIDDAKMPAEVENKALEELEKLKKTPSMSPEFSVNRTYIELLTTIPWSKRTDDNFDIEHVRRILDDDHYDLEKPKERILEYISVLNLVGNLKRQILCFVGPPGTGKTSLARSIARALNRNFIRFSLGGVRDEAEIRGHRRTYIGAMPGKIIQSMKKAGTVNPVILLDEIDKMTRDFRGDPSSALLEVLDPEQNQNFNDHYIEVDYDLSNVMFITTANVIYDIPLPLQDRMEIIQLTSYLDPDKLQIAKKHILPKVLKEFGLDNMNVSFSDNSLLKIIREYTRESGVRNLERQIGSILRKVAKEIVQEYDLNRKSKESRKKALIDNPNFNKLMKHKKFLIDENKIEEYLKAPIYKRKKEDIEDKVGVATGLAWTSVGGEILPIEVSLMPGSERLTLTGKLGDVMKESAQAALSYIRSNHAQLGLEEKFNKGKEIHIHVPEGAIPKDGPSAGITMALAMISAVSGIKLRGDLAMTGEITLRGKILPIGGLKEKLLAATRYGIKKVLVPKDNERDIIDIDDEIKQGLEIIPVAFLMEALPHAFNEKLPVITINKKPGKIRTKPNREAGS